MCSANNLSKFFIRRAMLFAAICIGSALNIDASHAADTCPAGYIAIEMPDVEIADSCPVDWTSAGTIEDCNTGAGVCANLETKCDAGYYLKDGACIGCKEGLATNAEVYCPGDNLQYKCPTWAETNPNIAEYEELVNATFVQTSGRTWTYTTTTYPSSKQNCYCNLIFSATPGKYVIQPAYDESVQKYWNLTDRPKKWYEAHDGYYLSNYFMTETSGIVEYYDVKACTNLPAEHAYYTGPGTPDDPVKTGGNTDYNDCPWECDVGYGRHGDVCEPLCSAGATEFHAGTLVFNMYPDSACDEGPALHIGLTGGTCCVHLVQGALAGAVNIEYEGKIYHTTN